MPFWLGDRQIDGGSGSSHPKYGMLFRFPEQADPFSQSNDFIHCPGLPDTP
jgi:hypothetical protein